MPIVLKVVPPLVGITCCPNTYGQRAGPAASPVLNSYDIIQKQQKATVSTNHRRVVVTLADYSGPGRHDILSVPSECFVLLFTTCTGIIHLPRREISRRMDNKSIQPPSVVNCNWLLLFDFCIQRYEALLGGWLMVTITLGNIMIVEKFYLHLPAYFSFTCTSVYLNKHKKLKILKLGTIMNLNSSIRT